MVPCWSSSLLFENPSVETSLAKRERYQAFGSFPGDTDPRAETQPGCTVATQGPKPRNSFALSKVSVLWTHVSFSPLHTLTFPHTLYTLCVSLSSVHTHVSLSPGHVCIPDPGNSCLQPITFHAASLLLPSCVSVETPGRIFYRNLQFLEPPIPRPATDRLRRGAFKTSHRPFLQSLFSKKHKLLPSKMQVVVTCQCPFQRTACRKSVVQHT